MDMDYERRGYLAAVALAHKAHAERKYGDFPYTVHLAHVENVLSTFGFNDSQLRAAAWLHDSVEDKTGVTLKEIGEACGLTVALYVEAVTDGEGKNRRERHVESFRRMQFRADAIPLKLADRIANVESCQHTNNNGLLAMYRKEYAEFRSQLYRASLTVGSTNTRVRAMWAYLDDLLDEGTGGEP